MKLYLKRGLPGSGKSTSAREMIEKDGNTARISFDDLRQMLFNGKWTPRKEKLLTPICAEIVRTLADFGYNVIIDNTNLTENHVARSKNMAEVLGMDFVEQRHDTSLPECVKRDNLRTGKDHVGRAVIERLGLSSGWIKLTGKPIVIVDVDGTLADSSWRAPLFLNSDPKDWDGFFAAAATDKPIEAVQKWVRTLYWSHEYEIVIMSGRSDDYCDLTVKWLYTHSIPFDHILMRKRGDKREDWIVKRELFNMLPKDQVAFVIDDREQVIEKCWRAVRQEENLSYRVFQVAEGKF